MRKECSKAVSERRELYQREKKEGRIRKQSGLKEFTVKKVEGGLKRQENEILSLSVSHPERQEEKPGNFLTGREENLRFCVKKLDTLLSPRERI